MAAALDASVGSFLPWRICHVCSTLACTEFQSATTSLASTTASPCSPPASTSSFSALTGAARALLLRPCHDLDRDGDRGICASSCSDDTAEKSPSLRSDVRLCCDFRIMLLRWISSSNKSRDRVSRPLRSYSSQVRPGSLRQASLKWRFPRLRRCRTRRKVTRIVIAITVAPTIMDIIHISLARPRGKPALFDKCSDNIVKCSDNTRRSGVHRH